MKAVLDADPSRYDSTAIYAPWRDLPKRHNSSLRLGTMVEEPAHPLHPPVRRTLDEATRILKAAGHEIIPLTREEGSISELCEVGWQLMSLDSHAADIVRAAGEPLVPSIANVAAEVARQDWPFAESIKDMPPLQRLAAINVRRAELVAHWHKIWSKHRIDAVLCPSARSTAVKHDTFGLFAYTLFLNTLDVGYPNPQGLIYVTILTIPTSSVSSLCFTLWPCFQGR